MFTMSFSRLRVGRLAQLGLALALAGALLLLVLPSYAQSPADKEAAPTATTGGPDLGGSSKSVNRTQARAGSNLEYTVIISNSGSLSATNVVITDALPAAVSYIEGTLTISSTGNVSQSLSSDADDTIVWRGDIGSAGSVRLTFDARLDEELMEGAVVTNQALIHYMGGEPMVRSASTTILPIRVYLPLLFTILPAPVINPIGHPTSANAWTVTWNAGMNVTGYELQESQSADFASPTTFLLDTASKSISHVASTRNQYFYRVRAMHDLQTSGWSNVASVAGAYADEFDDPTSGWAMRRTTYLEKVTGAYDAGTYVIKVDDRWDWGIFSPLAKAPTVPYVIEFRSKADSILNLVSGGLVLGGDWNGQPCPPGFDYNNVYLHTNCFNHFYNTNTINVNASQTNFKLVWERIDSLVWCPTCGGSPMKRLSSNEGSWPRIEPIPFYQAGWNVWRMEVRADGMKFFINGNQFVSYADSTYVNDPYFGFFTSSDEYKPSTWRFDYIRVTPLDN